MVSVARPGPVVLYRPLAGRTTTTLIKTNALKPPLRYRHSALGLYSVARRRNTKHISSRRSVTYSVLYSACDRHSANFLFMSGGRPQCVADIFVRALLTPPLYISAT